MGDTNINLLECILVADRYINLLKIHGCSHGTREPTLVTHDSESLIGHINHNDYQRPLKNGFLKRISQTILQLTLNKYQ